MFRARLYRDGLIIALLAADPLRLANPDLEIGRTLIKDGTKDGTTWSFNIPPEESENLLSAPYANCQRINASALPRSGKPTSTRYPEILVRLLSLLASYQPL